MEREMARGRDFNLDRIGFVLSLNPNTVQLQLINEREKSLLHFTAVGRKERRSASTSPVSNLYINEKMSGY